MKKLLILLITLTAISIIVTLLKPPASPGNATLPTPAPTTPSLTEDVNETAEPVSILTQNLDTPWAIVFLPTGDMLVTERKGTVQKISQRGEAELVTTIEDVREIGEGGLLGMTLHPDFSQNSFIYFYYTYAGSGENTLNRVVRYQLKNNAVRDRQIIVDAIPGAANHNGGRIAFGPDKFLYITTGDAQQPSQAQDTNSLAGKILRVTSDGKPASGNPFDNLVYSYGHRNPQGLAWDAAGKLWATEHGRSGIPGGLDELNQIEIGKNYGWPDSQGDQIAADTIGPILHSGSDTWAPASMVFAGGKLYFAGLRGTALYRYDSVSKKLEVFFRSEYGRLREVVMGPDGFLYVTTSNRDGRGSVKSGDDKILRVNISKL